MYSVTQRYIDTIRNIKIRKKTKITGTVDSIPFELNSILDGSFNISKSCSSGNNEVNIGQANIGELNCTLRNIDIPPGTWKGKEIEATFWLQIDKANDVWENVPLGIYTIDDAQISTAGVIIKAYDNMSKFTKSCSIRFTNAMPYDVLLYACTECDVALGNTRSEIETMSNGAEILTQYPESDIETWQDVIYWISQTLGGFATAGRDGKLYIRQYNQKIVDEIGASDRYEGCTFSDFKTKYTGISIVNVTNSETQYYGLEVDDGLTYNLGSNPFLQYGSTTQIESRRRKVLQALQNIKYVPFKATMTCNPMYDLGDVIVFKEGIAKDSKLCCITSFNFQFHRQYIMSGAGKDPSIASGKTKTDKNLEGLVNQVNKDTFRFDSVTNGREIKCEDQKLRRILRADIMTKANASVMINAEILLTITPTQQDVNIVEQLQQASRIVCAVTYQLDGEILSRKPVETWSTAGQHILTLQYLLSITDPGFHTFDIYVHVDGGSITIAPYDIQCVFSGIGIVADHEWSGKLELEDDAPVFELEELEFDITAYSESVSTSIIVPDRIILTDAAPVFELEEMEFDGSDYVDSVSFKPYISELLWREAAASTWGTLKEIYVWGHTGG